jgi:ABC-2 type transport system permease protein
MKNVLRIAKKELSTFFNSPVAYVVLGVFLALSGALYFFFSPLFIYNDASMRGFFSLMPVVFMFLAPAITMRLIAEERKSGTIESLLTLPLQEWEVVVGKYLAALAMVAIGVAFTISYPISLTLITAPGTSLDWGPVLGGYIGTMLLSSAFIAVGMWASSLGKDQIVGFIVGLAVCFLLWFPDQVAIFMPETLGNFLKYLSANHHFQNVARGVVDPRDLLYYGTVTAIGLIATTRMLASVRK